ncbi:hypothetical protein C2845_PM11G26040 [Panicum miliaceum]|uniref:RING-type E3 ubiquitin transferase n=1 Tax=Panicum miliaceum TaxID=4540 RepID=A0A3L6RUN6_PANMI|nr:hypothetical protein C2845_PM11G26040 [Panicum miliaceum]
MANDSLAHHLLRPLAAGCCADVDEYDEEPANVAFPSFWPPFPALSSDSDFDAASFLEDHDGHPRWDVGVSDADELEQVAAREEEEEAAAASAVRSLEWEVLLAASSLGSLVVDEDAGDDDDLDAGIETYFLDDAGDLLFGQLAAADADHGPQGKRGRPATKAAVEALTTVVVAEADAQCRCAVCKDGVEAGERARRLPCAHLYHDACILPWLAIRNTCPLCRRELPTDDPEYEKWKARRAGRRRGWRRGGPPCGGDRYDVFVRLP